MMKFLTTALGGLTILTVTGLATAQGQALLGMRQPQAAVPVSVIADPGPAQVAVPAAPAARPASAAPAAPPVAPRPAVTAPVARPVARPATPAAAGPAPAANPMGGLGGAGAITNLLLNMPQVLQGGQGGPDGPGVVNNGGGWGPPGQRGRDSRKRHDGGDNNSGDYER
jgi:hypothetical protein